MTDKTLEIIEGQYLEDLLAQPRALESTHAFLSAPGRWDMARRFVNSQSWKRVVLTGMGSSFHSLNPLYLRLIAQGRMPLLMETSELIHYGTALLDADTLLVVVSQSGQSAETLRLLECNRGAPILAVTNTPDSPLAAAGGCLLLLQAGIEATVSCKTYVSGLAALAWLSELLGGGTEKAALESLAPASDLVATYLDDWRGHTRALTDKLRAARHLFLVGRGPSLASAGTGALIIKESAHFHAEGMSSAAFRHGPLEMLQNELQTVVFAGDPQTRMLNERLLRDLRGQGARCEKISEDANFPPFRLPPACAPLMPILEILPVQMMSLALAALAGREAGRFQHASKITATE